MTDEDLAARMEQINAHMSVPLDMAMRFIGEEHDLSEIDYWCVRALRANGDERGTKERLAYIDARSSRMRMVSRFNPGKHYSALGKKFASLSEAQDHLAEHGYKYGGLRVVHLPREGD